MSDSARVVRIESADLVGMIEELSVFGRQPAGGITRPVYSAAWMQARARLAEWMRDAGLEVRDDAVGNLFGRLRGTDDDSRTILTGSHFDTVRLGGKYDGALGVLAGLAAVRALRQQAGRPRRALEVVALCEEEGSRFPANFWGTRAMLGLIRTEDMEALRDDAGTTIGDAMREAGFDPARYAEAVRTDLARFIELHIEQGRTLWAEQVDVGIVDAITGLHQQVITVEGRADHAGTTPMDLRLDAFQGAALMAVEATRMIEHVGRPAVVTMGQWDVQPGATNVVPGRVRFTVDLRHPDEAMKQRLAGSIREVCEAIARERGLTVTFDLKGDVLPVRMDEQLRAELTWAAETCGASWKVMASGAGHDSQVMARHVPAAMLFVPSVEGRSHSDAEYTRHDDAARGAAVLATALWRLAYDERAR